MIWREAGLHLGKLYFSDYSTYFSCVWNSIVDLHSHLGLDSAPALSGSSDTNSRQGLVLPWLRSLDGLNTHDDAYRLSISGGVTTANVLPGSANAIGRFETLRRENYVFNVSIVRWSSFYYQAPPYYRTVFFSYATRTSFHVESK